jgi:hypothetical protein
MGRSLLQRYRGDEWDWRVLVVLGACVYETGAIVTGRYPTITAIWHRLREHKVGRLGLWLALGWLIEHLFGEGR